MSSGILPSNKLMCSPTHKLSGCHCLRVFIELSLQPLSLFLGGQWSWKFQSFHHLAFLVTAPSKNYQGSPQKSPLFSISSSMVKRGLLWITKTPLSLGKFQEFWEFCVGSRDKNQKYFYIIPHLLFNTVAYWLLNFVCFDQIQT